MHFMAKSEACGAVITVPDDISGTPYLNGMRLPSRNMPVTIILQPLI
jgi:hypothetical protein